MFEGPIDVRALSDGALRDELTALFSDPVVRKVTLYLRLKEEFDNRQHRYLRGWQPEPSSSEDAIR